MLSVIIQDFRDALVLLILFGLTIFVHELGHFLVARWCGLVVDVFSIGFGPAIWKKKVGATEYKIGAIPCGGYVALPQLDPAGMSSVQGKADGEGEEPRQLAPVSAWKKILVAVSGATGNIILALVLAWIVHAGSSPLEEGAIVGTVETNSVAFAQGMRVGDRIVAVNGQEIASWYEYKVECVLGAGSSNVVFVTRTGNETREILLPSTEIEKGQPGVRGLHGAVPALLGEITPDSAADAAGLEPLDIVRVYDGVTIHGWAQFSGLVAERGAGEFEISVERSGKRVTSRVQPEYEEKFERAVIGVKLGVMPSVPWMQKHKPLDQIASDATGIARILRALLTRREAKQAAGALGGPVMIIIMLWASIKISYIYALGFLRFLNVNLAILNLLPIPVLDGGHIILALWEGITRRKVHAKFVTVLINLFFVLLIGVMLLLTFRDVRNFVPWFRKSSTSEAEGADKALVVDAESATNALSETNDVPGSGSAE